MRPRFHTRRMLKWIGTVACVVLLGIGMLSGWYQVVLGADGHVLGLCSGTFVFIKLLPGVWEGPPRLWGNLLRGGPRWCWWFSLIRGQSVCVPLWAPLTVSTLWTGLFWYVDRRRRLPPGYCQNCGYNLTGNISGTCPECGTRLKPDGENA